MLVTYQAKSVQKKKDHLLVKVFLPGFALAALVLSIYSPPGIADDVLSFTGTWQTNWGPVTLSQTQNNVTGTYTGGFSGDVEGKVDGKRLNFTWTQTNGEWGRGYFELANDGRSFKGRWGGGNSNNNGGSWDGTKK